ncbi:MAG TPA: hypothetical protein VJ653_03345 [Acidimicrobiales bacterium]|nr:hypothetical protein [Acidimicrobiales bacterium]
MSGVRVRAKRRFGQFLVTKPADVSIDGMKVGTAPWKGDGARFDVAPGRHVVQASFRYLGKDCGPAQAQVDVADGQEVALLYRSPWVVTMKGTLTVQ